MVATVFKRLLQGLIITVVVIFISFTLLRLIPGDPAKAMSPLSSPEQLQEIRNSLGLGKPISAQFQMYIGELLKGNFGQSYFEHASVSYILMKTLPLSLFLMISALTISILLGLVFGSIAAIKRNGWQDHLISNFAILLQSMPNYWVAAMLILLLSVRAGLFPAMDYKGPIYTVLPSIVLALPLAAVLIKNIRLSLIDSYSQEFTRAAYARGISKKKIYFEYALRNSVIPLLTTLGNQLGFLIGSVVLVEYVFNYPGIGFELMNAITRRDYNLVEAIIIIFSVSFIIINMIIDISYAYLDPRIMKAQGGLNNE